MNRLQVWFVAECKSGLREQGMKQKDLARAAGVTPKHVSALMRGRASGSLELWMVLLECSGRGSIIPELEDA